MEAQYTSPDIGNDLSLQPTTLEPTPAPMQQPQPPSRDITIGVGQRGLSLTSFEDMWRFGVAVHRAGWGPKGSTPDSNLVAMQLGAEVGMGPMQSIQNIAVINGRPSVWGDALLGLCKASASFDHRAFREWYTGSPGADDFAAHCQVKRLSESKPTVSSYSIAMAKRAKLWGKSGPWQTDPERMLRYRARAFACRDCFPDVLKGLHAAEEMADNGPIGIEIEGVPQQDALPPPPTGTRTEQLAEKAKRVSKAAPKPPPPVPNETTTQGPPPPDPDRLASLRTGIQRGLLELEPTDQAKFMGNFQLKAIGELGEIADIELLTNMMAELKRI